MKALHTASAKVVINPARILGTVNPRIYGQFAEHLGHCIYEGLWVGEDSPIPNTRGIRTDVLQALQRLNIPVLRWPGGCFADEYHWKDGIGPRESRKRMVNTHWGGVVENNHFGTHEFFTLCELLGTEAYLAGNVGSGTVQEMQEWVDYITFDGESPMAALRAANGRKEPWKLPWIGIGNENWGCGGNMRAEYYADLYRQFQTYVRNHHKDNKVRKIAGGPNSGDWHWTEVMMKQAHWLMDGLSLHNYTVPGTWAEKGGAMGFRSEAWYEVMRKTMAMDGLITKHSAIMDQYDPDRRVGLVVDEWGTWYAPQEGTNPGFLRQQNSLRDALVAGMHLHVFHKHHARVHMANIAQMVNVLQAMILTEGDKMVRTPTYHVFEMFKAHQGGGVLDVWLTLPGNLPHPEHNERLMEGVPALTLSATRSKDGAITVSACNPRLDLAMKTRIEIPGMTAVQAINARIRVLTHEVMDAHNSVKEGEKVSPRDLAAAESGAGFIEVHLPPASVTVLEIKA